MTIRDSGKVLVDTSAWIDYFRKKEPAYCLVSELLREERICCIGIVLAELLQGAKSTKEIDVIKDFIHIFEFLPERPQLWEQAGELSWTVHRARETPRKTVLVSVFILAFIVFTFAVFGFLLALLAALVLFLALNTYFLPVTTTFTGTGIEIDKRLYRASYQWKQFRRWFRTTGGVVVSPFSRRNYLDNFRGVHLLLPDDPSAIVAYLEKRFAPPKPDNRLTLDEDLNLEDTRTQPEARTPKPE